MPPPTPISWTRLNPVGEQLGTPYINEKLQLYRQRQLTRNQFLRFYWDMYNTMHYGMLEKYKRDPFYSLDDYIVFLRETEVYKMLMDEYFRPLVSNMCNANPQSGA